MRLCRVLSAAILALGFTSQTVLAKTIPLATTAVANADIDPFSTVNTLVALTDDGTNLTVVGQGSGFTPGLTFVSLIYADPSVQRGPLACLPPGPVNPYSPSQMFVGYWLPIDARERSLFVVKTGAAYVALSSIDTISVRYDSTPTVSPLLNQNPGRFYLQSCGSVHLQSRQSARVRH